MELVLSNPFRILGLPVKATSREIAKRISDLEMFAELGKNQSYPSDLIVIGLIDRSFESIKNAARKIELNDSRLFHSFFWFRCEDAIDELALDCLANLNASEALKIWTKQIKKSKDFAKSNWRINRTVLCLFLTNNFDADKAYFEQVLEDISYLTFDLYDETVKEIPGSEIVSRRHIFELILENLITYAANSKRQTYGPNAIHLIRHCEMFCKEGLDFIKERVSKPLINQIKDATLTSKAKRDDGASVDDFRRKNGLIKVEKIIYELKNSLGEENPTFQAIANCFADEVFECAVMALNEYKAVTTAIVLADWAAELPSFGQSRKRIMLQRKIIISWDSEYVADDDSDFDISDIEDSFDPHKTSDSKSSEPLLNALSTVQKISLFKLFGLNEVFISASELQIRIEKLKSLVAQGKSTGYLTRVDICVNSRLDSHDEDAIDKLIELFNELGVAVFEDDPVEEVEEVEVDDLVSPSQKISQGVTICPRCYSHFSHEEVIEHTAFGVRCPHCKQSIVI